MIDRILSVLRDGGATFYLGEPVTQLEHALQTAALAEGADAPEALVVASLLHDIGHLLEPVKPAANSSGDARHENVGHYWLAYHFGREVTEPIRLHVAAKRYLCAVDTGYVTSLSATSRATLGLQGGPMTVEEVRLFEQTPWANDAVALRRWDDAAKRPGLDVPGLSHYRSRIDRLLETR